MQFAWLSSIIGKAELIPLRNDRCLRIIMTKDCMKINLSLQLKECENLDRGFYPQVTHKAVGSGVVLPTHFSTSLN